MSFSFSPEIKKHSLPDYRGWFSGKTVLITGATSGVGRECAKLLTLLDSKVVPCGTNEDAMKSLIEEIKSISGAEPEGFIADFSDGKSLRDMIARIKKRFTVDVLINSAGFGYIDNFHDMPYEKIHSMLMVNIFAIVELCRAFLPDMMKKNGAGILNIGSTASFFATPGSALYGSTKHFVLGFTDALHHEMLQRGVHVTGVYPGHIYSRFLERSTGGKAKDWGKAMHPEDVAKMALRCLMENKRRCIPGIKNKLKVFASYILPAPIIFRKVYSNASRYFRV